MSQYAMVIDLNRCVGCHACALACRAEWNVPVPYHRNWVEDLGPEETSEGLSYTFFPAMCNHCDHPVCVEVCPTEPIEKEFRDPKTGKTIKMAAKATYKNPINGLVLIDKDRCLGCGACVDACPYGARYLDDTLDEPKADKCTFCIERLERGEVPACVKTCPVDARIFGDITDKDSEVHKLVHKKGAKSLTSKEVDIGPNVYYLGKKKDIELLFRKCAPHKRTWESVKAPSRRDVLVAAVKKIRDKV